MTPAPTTETKSTTFTYSIRTATGFRSKMEGKLRSFEQHGVASAALNGDLSDDINALLAAPDLLQAACDLAASRSSTFKARNGREVGIQDENGEKMWIVSFDEMLALEAAIAKAEGI